MTQRRRHANQPRPRSKSPAKAAKPSEPPASAPQQFPLPLAGLERTASQIELKYSGPIPPPEVMARYNDIVPGMAADIMKMAQDEQAHRHKIIEQAVEANIRTEKRGQYLGFTIAIVALILSAGIIYFGRAHAGAVAGGTALGVGDIVALVALFVRRESEDKKDAGE